MILGIVQLNLSGVHNRGAFDRFIELLSYKAEMEGILVYQVSERYITTSRSCRGHMGQRNQVKHGLYVCDKWGTTANADVVSAENIRQEVYWSA